MASFKFSPTELEAVQSWEFESGQLYYDNAFMNMYTHTL